VPDVFDPPARSEVMRRVKGRDTGPELKVRRLLTRLGARYRLHRADLPGRPDIVLPGRRLAIFVHGCFWHRHGCTLSSEPRTRRRFWREKFDRNVARDARNARELRKLGWRVLTVWECALRTQAKRERAVASLIRRIRA